MTTYAGGSRRRARTRQIIAWRYEKFENVLSPIVHVKPMTI